MSTQLAAAPGGSPLAPEEEDVSHSGSLKLGAPAAALMAILEGLAAALMVGIVLLLLGGVVSRYVFDAPVVWIDEVSSVAFLWLAMLGATIAMHRNEHLRLNLLVDLLSDRAREYVHGLSLAAIAALLLTLIWPAYQYTREEWIILTPALSIPRAFKVGAIAFGFTAMLLMVLAYAGRTVKRSALAAGVLVVAAVVGVCWALSPQLAKLGKANIPLFLGGFTAAGLLAGIPIAFCFGIGAVSLLVFTTSMPLMVVVGRMDEGMSSLVLISVPIFVLLGCVLDATGMGKAIVDFLASLLNHVKAGMSYVLLGSLFIVSGISGSKVSDMATVAPALFPEMKRRGNKPAEMVALLATGAAMADTVPPSIVLIVLGAAVGASISGLFQAGFVVAMVLLATLLILARWKARHEDLDGIRRTPREKVFRFALIAAPALVLPFLIRALVGEGIATATEVSTVAVLYALVIGQLLYGGITARSFYLMLVESAALTGAVLLILGAASIMAWTITQSGVVQQLSGILTTLPGGSFTFMLVTIVAFLVLGCLLEGLPAVLLLAPIMYPIARKLGIDDIHYSMVVVCAMNIGLMMPPIGVGYYIACRIGDVRPDEVIRPIWSYLAALLIGVLIIAAVPAISRV